MAGPGLDSPLPRLPARGDGRRLREGRWPLLLNRRSERKAHNRAAFACLLGSGLASVRPGIARLFCIGLCRIQRWPHHEEELMKSREASLQEVRQVFGPKVPRFIE